MEKATLTDEHRLWLEENYSRMYAFALSQLRDKYAAEDAVCDAAAVLIAKYGTRKGEFSSWAWGILRKIILRFFRENMRRMREDDVDSYTEVLADTTLPPAEDLIMAHERGQVRRILAMMPADIRRVLEERYIGERSYTEIADILEISLSSVTWRIHEGKKQMRKEWEFMELDTYMKDGYYAPVDMKIDVRWRMKGHRSEMHSESLKKSCDALSNLIAKNIAAVCYDSPKNVTDISRIMGVPAVYIEEALAKLIENGLMKQISNRYQTAFPIIGEELFERMKKVCAQKCREMYKKWADLLTDAAEKTEFSSSAAGAELTSAEKVYVLLSCSNIFGHTDPFSDDGNLIYPTEKNDISLCVKAYGEGVDNEGVFALENWFIDCSDSAGRRVELHFEGSQPLFDYQDRIDELTDEIRCGRTHALLYESYEDFVRDAEEVRDFGRVWYEDQTAVKNELVSAVLVLLPERFRECEAYVNCELRNFILAGFQKYLVESGLIVPTAYVIIHSGQKREMQTRGYTAMY